MKNVITLEEAQAVIRVHREAEHEAKRAEMLPYVGRFFKYRNNYGANDKGWWLYAQVTSIDALGWPQGWSFELTTEHIVEIKTRDRGIHIQSGGWKEITADEFWRAAATLGVAVTSILARKPAPRAQVTKRTKRAR